MSSSTAVAAATGRPQPRQLVGVRNSDHQPLPVTPTVGLVAGVEQQDAGADELVLGEHVAVVDDLRQRR
jgi:hypothetical protein